MKSSSSLFLKCRRVLLSLLVSAGAMSSAHALVITEADAPQSFSFSSTQGGYNMLVTGTIDITALSTTSATVQFMLNNASTLSGGGAIANSKDVRLTSFGFGIDPNISAVSFSDAADGGMVAAVRNTGGNTNIPSLTGIEVCTFGGNNCSGGSNDGIWAGLSDTFSLILTGNFGSSLTFDPLGVKFQTANGSFEFSCTGTGCGEDGGGPGGSVPEPATMALLGFGLLGIGAARRRAVLKPAA